MKVDYIDHMGDDLSVVNSARVSFDKESDWEAIIDIDNGTEVRGCLFPRDRQLISYLATHGHWSPFAHTSVSFRFKAPIFVARQLHKHQVGMTVNEVSRRYVKAAPELWWPEKWRKAAENVKQGSSDEEYNGGKWEPVLADCKLQSELAVERYSTVIEQGMCPEQARMFLPLNTMTTWVWTGSLYAWARVWKQRTYPTTQKETQDCVKLIGPTMERLFPVSWAALTKE